MIPGRNCAKTLRRCLGSVIEMLEERQLAEIIFVDDGSTDDTASIAAEYAITVLTGEGRGPGAARNLGWRHSTTDFVWFIDSDCVAHSDALEILLKHFSKESTRSEASEPKMESCLAGVGGSYSNLFPQSVLATLIHAEIVARHRRMPQVVNFLATFNVLYRRDVLDQVGGFDESLKLAQDAELAFRICDAGHRLHFDIDSKVGHHHPTKLWGYLKTQARQGYYRMALYRRHPGKIKGDSYAGLLDYVQPPLAMLLVASLPLIALSLVGLTWILILPTLLLLSLLLCQMPMAVKMSVGYRRVNVLYFVSMSSLRALARGIGMTLALVRFSEMWTGSCETPHRSAVPVCDVAKHHRLSMAAGVESHEGGTI
ncbi:glycosyltransferase [Rubripirellula amarantea]|nr:glycosyltransferase [Rubripirellula amarantea]